MSFEGVRVSVVIPVYNEEENVAPLLEELFPVLGGLGPGFEVLCIDDASTDHTLRELLRLRHAYPGLRVIRHRVNCGESAATATGFARAGGDVIITMDADQQNDPADIPALLRELEGVDAVCGVRKKREDNRVKRISSRIANCFRNRVTGDRIADAGCTFRALRRDALEEIPVFNGMHRFLPTLLRFQGFRVKEIPVNHRPRIRGESKYGIGNRMFRGLVDCFAMIWWRRRSFPGRRSLPEDEPAAS